jgi:hypothetical protein
MFYCWVSNLSIYFRRSLMVYFIYELLMLSSVLSTSFLPALLFFISLLNLPFLSLYTSSNIEWTCLYFSLIMPYRAVMFLVFASFLFYTSFLIWLKYFSQWFTFYLSTLLFTSCILDKKYFQRRFSMVIS